MRENAAPEIKVPPAAIAVIVAAVLGLGFLAYRAAQPPAPTVPIPAASQIDPRNPSRPPVADEHANDWRPPR